MAVPRQGRSRNSAIRAPRLFHGTLIVPYFQRQPGIQCAVGEARRVDCCKGQSCTMLLVQRLCASGYALRLKRTGSRSAASDVAEALLPGINLLSRQAFNVLSATKDS